MSEHEPTLEQAVRAQLLASADQMAAAASRLREAIAQRHTPPHVGARLAARLDELADQMRRNAQQGPDE